MLFASLEIASVKMTARNVQMRCSVSGHGRQIIVVAQHAPEPAQSLAEIAAHHRRQAQIMSNQAGVMLVTLLFGNLQSGAELALCSRQIACGVQAKPSRVAALDLNGWLPVG